MLCEGAQGTMLDVDFGSYPFVTSSNTICAGACTGLGIGPNKIGDVFGIMKAYCTRVGAGPFPTELFDETGKTIRDLGHEYGAVTGRERRCGWIDLVALRYSIMVNGVTQLIMMKSDVLDGFDTIKACVAYKQNGVEIDYFPYNIEEGIEPVYKELPGWKTDMTKFTSENQFPKEFSDYISFLENATGGMDIIGMLISKSHGNVSVGQVNLAVNLVIYAVCLFLFDVQTVVYSVIFAVVHAFAIDKFHAQNINVEVKIITKTDPAVIEQDVFTKIVRGVTELRSVGAYTHEEEHILYIIISKYEVHQLRQIVRKHDKNAFIIVNEGVWVEGHFLKKL